MDKNPAENGENEENSKLLWRETLAVANSGEIFLIKITRNQRNNYQNKLDQSDCRNSDKLIFKLKQYCCQIYLSLHKFKNASFEALQ